MIQAIPTILAAVTALDLPLALIAHWSGRRRAAHVLNGVALGATCAGSVVAFLQSGAANAHLGGLASLLALAGLTGLCFWNTGRPLMPGLVFWLAWCANLGIVALLLYLLIWFKVF